MLDLIEESFKKIIQDSSRVKFWILKRTKKKVKIEERNEKKVDVKQMVKIK